MTVILREFLKDSLEADRRVEGFLVTVELAYWWTDPRGPSNTYNAAGELGAGRSSQGRCA